MRHIPSDEYYQLPPPGYSYPPYQKEKELHLRDYWKVVRKRRWMIIAIFLIAVVISAIKTYTTKPVYRGTATVQINIESPQIVDFREIFAVNLWAMDYYQTQYKILESRNLARRVIQGLKLSEHPEFLPQPATPFEQWKSNVVSSIYGLFTFFNNNSSSLKESLTSKDSLSNKDPSENDKDTPYIGQFLGRLKIEPIKDSRLVKIHFDAYNPDLAGRVPNALSDAYVQLSLEARLNTTEQAKEWLSKQLEDLKAKVERADEALQEFGSKYGIITIDDKENITIKRLSELNEALAKAESERMAKEAIYKQIKQDKYRTFDVLPSVLENKLIQELKQTYIQLEAQYMKLAETFKPNYPEMVRLKSQMEAIQRRLNMEVDKIVAGMKSEYESGLRRESLLRAAFEQQKVKTMEMQQKSIQYNILKREADTNKELYKNLLQRMKEVGISATIHASNIQIVDKAEVPTAPYKPNAQRTLFNAAMVALFLGVGLAFFFEYLDNTVKAPEDVERLTQLPSLGIVPEISHEKQRRLERGAVYPVELVTFGYPKSALSEAYRSIRTSILLSSPEKPPKRVAITSPNPLEGKTTTVINTAIALSQAGAKVLIIDTDMRKPRVHKVFDGKKNEMGLSSFLSGNVEFESIIKKSEIPNLYYIPAGPIPPNPSELISSSLFKRMIESLENRFDHIVFDSPPVLGFADSVILSTYVDGIILVVMCGKTPKETLQMAKDVLYQVNAKILGVVINRVDIRRMEYDYYYRYHYYYGKEGKKREIPHILNKRSMRT